MNLTEELVQRCALKRRAAIGSMSDAAYEELLLAVQSDLKSYASETDELPMYHLAQAAKRYQDSQFNDDSYTDEEFVQARITRQQLAGRMRTPLDSSLPPQPASSFWKNLPLMQSEPALRWLSRMRASKMRRRSTGLTTDSITTAMRGLSLPAPSCSLSSHVSVPREERSRATR